MEDTYVEEEEVEEARTGVVRGLDGVSPQTVRENEDDDDVNPENEKEKAHAASTVLNFSENCTPDILTPYLDRIVSKLLVLLQQMVQEGALTALASVSDSSQKQFQKYYDVVMPYLKAILVNVTDKYNRMLCVKSKECISLVGMAVGKEKFRDDAKQVHNGHDLLICTFTTLIAACVSMIRTLIPMKLDYEGMREVEVKASEEDYLYHCQLHSVILEGPERVSSPRNCAIALVKEEDALATLGVLVVTCCSKK
ncbi:hypothetical protein GIB67_003096 [Kingdonia uniflora]|uniref:Uncharacterized protein n=1 Tax=Kingdonia uniflora TaxID=39325 RepID=A0A7J7N696_9MAGN|nr:hypothetical protein GIB67_003096 [Kingdonia uniflora]